VRLIVLAIWPAAHQLYLLGSAVVAHRLVHEDGMVVDIEAKQRKRQPPADLFEHVDQQRLLAHQKRRKFRPAGRNFRDDERLHECTIRHRTRVRDEVSFNEARWRIAPVRKGPNRDRSADCRYGAWSSPPRAAALSLRL